jgi:DNA-binding transcriptional LysR family regulator
MQARSQRQSDSGLYGDMTQVEAFLALAGELHFGRAVERLHVSQPRVSRLIAALERQAAADRESR